MLQMFTNRLRDNFDLPSLMRITEQRPLTVRSMTTVNSSNESASSWRVQPLIEQGASIRIAVAYDEAFHCYFPDTLDLLEARGASICDFSPLRDETLPSDCDVVYLGCGCPERYADPLAENHCMKQALRSYIELGGRVYAEGGGLAYLCQQVVLPSGRRLPMVGALPAVAVRNTHIHAPQPTEVTLVADNWLVEAGGRLRGYMNSNWRIHPVGALSSLVKEAHLRTALVGRTGVIGSRMHLNFAAQPSFLRRFFQPVPLVGHAFG
jgi:cobyrinic acid a,c-diamide synthase